MKIELTNMEFFAYHGVFPEERELGNIFLVNISMELDAPKACYTDALEDTLNYQEIYDVVKAEMAIPSKLLEHVTARIKHTICLKFPFIKDISVRVSKKNPPLGGKVDWVSIEL